MARYLRRGCIGLLAGVASTIPLTTTLPNRGVGIVFGFLVGVGYTPVFAPTPPVAPTQILILGGGFAGMTTAATLERLCGADRSVALTLVSDTNALLFTPMLAEVAGSSLEPTHISTPLRTSLRRTRVVRGRVTHIDLE